MRLAHCPPTKRAEEARERNGVDEKKRRRSGDRCSNTAVSEIIIARYEKCSAALANVYITERPNLRHF